MNLDRAVGLVIMSAASTLALAACRSRDRTVATQQAAPDLSAAAAAPAARPALAPADAAAYRRGREREVALMRDAVARLHAADGDSVARRAAMRATVATEVERSGAAAAGLSPSRYRALVAHVDSALRVRAGALAREGGEADGGAAGSSDALPPAQWRLLDSLRVEWAVLRSRFVAESGDGRGWTP